LHCAEIAHPSTRKSVQKKHKPISATHPGFYMENLQSGALKQLFHLDQSEKSKMGDIRDAQIPILEFSFQHQFTLYLVVANIGALVTSMPLFSATLLTA
jgi:hypothetical protein